MRYRINIQIAADDPHFATIKSLVFQNHGLIKLPYDGNELNAAFTSTRKATNFITDILHLGPLHKLYFNIINRKPLEKVTKKRFKYIDIFKVVDPRPKATYTITYLIDSEQAGYATYLAKTHNAICPPYQIKRDNDFMEQSVYYSSINEFIDFLYLFHFKFGKKFIVQSIVFE